MQLGGAKHLHLIHTDGLFLNSMKKQFEAYGERRKMEMEKEKTRQLLKHCILCLSLLILSAAFALLPKESAKAATVKSVSAKKLISGKSIVTAKGIASFSAKGDGKSVTVKASIADKGKYHFGHLLIWYNNSMFSLGDFTGKTSINTTIDLSRFDPGIYTIFLFVYTSDGKAAQILYKENITYTGITAKPTYKGKFDVYSKYFYYYPYNMAMSNQAGKLYMEYSANGGKTWKRTGYMQANPIKLYIQQNYTISGLTANTKYVTRIRYGNFATYDKFTASNLGVSAAAFKDVFGKTCLGDGKTHFLGGPVLNTGTIKTGKAAKPKIKKISVKAIKVKRHKVRHYGYYTGVYLYTEKFYTCKFRVTIKLKKKPRAAGIWVNGRFLKGNKKTYKTTFTPYPNYYTKRPPKGLKKYGLSICSYQSKAYGGYSPLKVKKVKIK